MLPEDQGVLVCIGVPAYRTVVVMVHGGLHTLRVLRCIPQHPCMRVHCCARFCLQVPKPAP